MIVVGKEMVNKASLKLGSIAVCYLTENREYVFENIISVLESKGYEVHGIELNDDFLNELHYYYSIIKLLKDVECGVFYLTDDIVDEKCDIYLNSLFYIFGILIANNKRILSLLSQTYSSRVLEELYIKTSPISTTLHTNSVDELIHRIDNMGLNREVYNGDVIKQNVNLYLKKNVTYSKLTVILNLKEEVLEKLFLEGDWEDNPQGKYESMIDDLIEFTKCGANIIRFGKNSHVGNTAFYPYKEDCSIIEFDTPGQHDMSSVIKLINQKFNKSKYDEKSYILKFEFMLPVHSVLGTSFKAYLELDEDSDWTTEDIKMLLNNDTYFDDDYRNIVIDSDSDNRVYFLIPVNFEDAPLTLKHKYGSTINFIYPK